MRHALLLAGAVFLAAGTVPAQEPTGTTGATAQEQAPPASSPTPRVRTIIPPAGSDAPQPADLPLSARPGQCFARVRAPGALETFQARVLVSPERKEARQVPAVYEDVAVQVLVSRERVERIRIPATFKMATETVVVRPERVRVERIPPEYDTVSEQVVVREGGLQWRPAASLAGPLPSDPRRLRRHPTGEVYCLVEVAPVIRTVRRRVLVHPGRSIESRDPAVTREVTRRVVDQPARVEERTVPAVYRTETKRRLVTPSRTETVIVPAEWRTVEQTRRTGPMNLEWREAPCAKSVTPALIRRVQEALDARGFRSGRADGIYGDRTREALERFQTERGLHTGGLTVEALAALGVN